MIPLESILALLDELRAESYRDVEAVSDGTAFGYGQLNGRLQAYTQVLERLNQLIESNSEDER